MSGLSSAIVIVVKLEAQCWALSLFIVYSCWVFFSFPGFWASNSPNSRKLYPIYQLVWWVPKCHLRKFFLKKILSIMIIYLSHFFYPFKVSWVLEPKFILCIFWLLLFFRSSAPGHFQSVWLPGGNQWY